MTKNELPNVLTAQNIAEYLKISRRRVYELFQLSEEAGGIRCFEIGLSKRVEKEDFVEWLESQKKMKQEKLN
ncbi:helix-turn-helix domain-containing protein [Alkalihalobacterium elongatum]|uniref:helix-turn-helix domain-containing protein n=1 Tax=Alkalihalobacterium elongatum TaxID=2675466 RepID=UPI001C1FC439|nr:helix-turn-helix domain-containing protein [Alkalihalobacterium elongatum]